MEVKKLDCFPLGSPQTIVASHRDGVDGYVGRPGCLLFHPCNNRTPLEPSTKTLAAKIMHPPAELPGSHLVPNRFWRPLEPSSHLGNGEILLRRGIDAIGRLWHGYKRKFCPLYDRRNEHAPF